MTKTRLTATLTLLAAATGCMAERSLAPEGPKSTVSSSVLAPPAQLPLLFVVDGVRYPRNQIPSLDPNRVSTIYILKGTAALKQFGTDAAYGVVLITTKSAPRS